MNLRDAKRTITQQARRISARLRNNGDAEAADMITWLEVAARMNLETVRAQQRDYGRSLKRLKRKVFGLKARLLKRRTHTRGVKR